MSPRTAGKLAREMSERLARPVYVIRDDEGALLAWSPSQSANGSLLIGAPEDVRQDGAGFYLASTGERIGGAS